MTHPCSATIVLQASAASPWVLKLGVRRELGLYADTIAKRGAHYFFYAWELPVGLAAPSDTFFFTNFKNADTWGSVSHVTED